MSAAVDQTPLDHAAGRNGVAIDGPCLVVGYDRSESARGAVSWAASALPDNGQLVVVHACRPLHAPPSPLATASDRHRLGRAMLDELLLDSENAILGVIAGTELRDEDPASALTNAALRHGGCPIVVGHDRHSLLHRATGTVTSELLARSPVPVVVVPPREQ